MVNKNSLQAIPPLLPMAIPISCKDSGTELTKITLRLYAYLSAIDTERNPMNLPISKKFTCKYGTPFRYYHVF